MRLLITVICCLIVIHGSSSVPGFRRKLDTRFIFPQALGQGTSLNHQVVQDGDRQNADNELKDQSLPTNINIHNVIDNSYIHSLQKGKLNINGNPNINYDTLRSEKSYSGLNDGSLQSDSDLIEGGKSRSKREVEKPNKTVKTYRYESQPRRSRFSYIQKIQKLFEPKQEATHKILTKHKKIVVENHTAHEEHHSEEIHEHHTTTTSQLKVSKKKRKSKRKPGSQGHSTSSAEDYVDEESIEEQIAGNDGLDIKNDFSSVKEVKGKKKKNKLKRTRTLKPNFSIIAIRNGTKTALGQSEKVLENEVNTLKQVSQSRGTHSNGITSVKTRKSAGISRSSNTNLVNKEIDTTINSPTSVAMLTVKKVIKSNEKNENLSNTSTATVKNNQQLSKSVPSGGRNLKSLIKNVFGQSGNNSAIRTNLEAEKTSAIVKESQARRNISTVINNLLNNKNNDYTKTDNRENILNGSNPSKISVTSTKHQDKAPLGSRVTRFRIKKNKSILPSMGSFSNKVIIKSEGENIDIGRNIETNNGETISKVPEVPASQTSVPNSPNESANVPTATESIIETFNRPVVPLKPPVLRESKLIKNITKVPIETEKSPTDPRSPRLSSELDLPNSQQLLTVPILPNLSASTQFSQSSKTRVPKFRRPKSKTITTSKEILYDTDATDLEESSAQINQHFEINNSGTRNKVPQRVKIQNSVSEIPNLSENTQTIPKSTTLTQISPDIPSSSPLSKIKVTKFRRPSSKTITIKKKTYDTDFIDEEGDKINHNVEIKKSGTSLNLPNEVEKLPSQPAMPNEPANVPTGTKSSTVTLNLPSVLSSPPSVTRVSKFRTPKSKTIISWKKAFPQASENIPSFPESKKSVENSRNIPLLQKFQNLNPKIRKPKFKTVTTSKDISYDTDIIESKEENTEINHNIAVDNIEVINKVPKVTGSLSVPILPTIPTNVSTVLKSVTAAIPNSQSISPSQHSVTSIHKLRRPKSKIITNSKEVIYDTDYIDSEAEYTEINNIKVPKVQGNLPSVPENTPNISETIVKENRSGVTPFQTIASRKPNVIQDTSIGVKEKGKGPGAPRSPLLISDQPDLLIPSKSSMTIVPELKRPKSKDSPSLPEIDNENDDLITELKDKKTGKEVITVTNVRQPKPLGNILTAIRSPLITALPDSITSEPFVSGVTNFMRLNNKAILSSKKVHDEEVNDLEKLDSKINNKIKIKINNNEIALNVTKPLKSFPSVSAIPNGSERFQNFSKKPKTEGDIPVIPKMPKVVENLPTIQKSSVSTGNRLKFFSKPFVPEDVPREVSLSTGISNDSDGLNLKDADKQRDENDGIYNNERINIKKKENLSAVKKVPQLSKYIPDYLRSLTSYGNRPSPTIPIFTPISKSVNIFNNIKDLKSVRNSPETNDGSNKYENKSKGIISSVQNLPEPTDNISAVLKPSLLSTNISNAQSEPLLTEISRHQRPNTISSLTNSVKDVRKPKPNDKSIRSEVDDVKPKTILNLPKLVGNLPYVSKITAVADNLLKVPMSPTISEKQPVGGPSQTPPIRIPKFNSPKSKAVPTSKVGRNDIDELSSEKDITKINDENEEDIIIEHDYRNPKSLNNPASVKKKPKGVGNLSAMRTLPSDISENEPLAPLKISKVINIPMPHKLNTITAPTTDMEKNKQKINDKPDRTFLQLKPIGHEPSDTEDILKYVTDNELSKPQMTKVPQPQVVPTSSQVEKHSKEADENVNPDTKVQDENQPPEFSVQTKSPKAFWNWPFSAPSLTSPIRLPNLRNSKSKPNRSSQDISNNSDEPQLESNQPREQRVTNLRPSSKIVPSYPKSLPDNHSEDENRAEEHDTTPTIYNQPKNGGTSLSIPTVSKAADNLPAPFAKGSWNWPITAQSLTTQIRLPKLRNPKSKPSPPSQDITNNSEEPESDSNHPREPRVPKIKPSSNILPSYLENLPGNHSEDENRPEDHDTTPPIYHQSKNGGSSQSIPTVSKPSNNLPGNTKSPKESWDWPFTAPSLKSSIRFPKLKNPNSKPSPSTQDINIYSEEPETESKQPSEPRVTKIRPSSKSVPSSLESSPNNHSEDENRPEDHDTTPTIYHQPENGGSSPSIPTVSKPSSNLPGKTKSPKGSWNWPFTASSLTSPIRFPKLKNPNNKPGPSTQDININREQPETESKQPSETRVPKIRPSSKIVLPYLENSPDNHSEDENRPEDHDTTPPIYHQSKNGRGSPSIPKVSKPSSNIPGKTKSPMSPWNKPFSAPSLTYPIRFPELRNPKSKSSPSTQNINNNSEEPESESNQLPEPRSPKIRPSNKFVLSYPKSLPDNHSKNENRQEDNDSNVPIDNQPKNGGNFPSVMSISKSSSNLPGKTKSPKGSWNWPITAPSLKSPIKFPKLKNPKSKPSPSTQDINNISEEPESESNQPSEPRVPKSRPSSKIVLPYLENSPDNHSEDENRQEDHDTTPTIYNQPMNGGSSLSIPTVSKPSNNLPGNPKSPKGSWNWPFTAPSLTSPIRFPKLRNPKSNPSPLTQDVNNNSEEPESESNQASETRSPKIRPNNKFVLSYPKSLPDNHSENENRQEDNDSNVPIDNQPKNGGNFPSVMSISKSSNNLQGKTKSPKGSWNWPFTAPSLKSPIKFPKLKNPKSKPSPSTQDINNISEEPESETNQPSEPRVPKIRPSSKIVLPYLENSPDNHSEDENRQEDHDTTPTIYNQPKNGGTSLSIPTVSKPSNNLPGDPKSPKGSWNWTFTAPSLTSPIRFPKLRNPKSNPSPSTQDVNNNSEEPESESNQSSETRSPKIRQSNKFVLSYPKSLPDNHSENENRQEDNDSNVPIDNQPKNGGNFPSVMSISKSSSNLPGKTKSPKGSWNWPFTAPSLKSSIKFPKLKNPKSKPSPSTEDINNISEEPESETNQPSEPRVPKIRPSSKIVLPYLENSPDNHSEDENRQEDHDTTPTIYNQPKNGGTSLSIPTVSKPSNNLLGNPKSPKGSWNWPFTAPSLTSPIRFPKLRNPKSKPSPSTHDINNNSEEPESESNQPSETRSPKIRQSSKFVLPYLENSPDNRSENENRQEDNDSNVPIDNQPKNGGNFPSVMSISKSSSNLPGKTKSPKGSWNWPFTASSLTYPIRFPKLRNPKSKPSPSTQDINNNREEPESESNQLSEPRSPKIRQSNKFVLSYPKSLTDNHNEDENNPEDHDTIVPIYNKLKNGGNSLSNPTVSKLSNNPPGKTKSPKGIWNWPFIAPSIKSPIRFTKLRNPKSKPILLSYDITNNSEEHELESHSFDLNDETETVFNQAQSDTTPGVLNIPAKQGSIHWSTVKELLEHSDPKIRPSSKLVPSYLESSPENHSEDENNPEDHDTTLPFYNQPKNRGNSPSISMVSKPSKDVPGKTKSPKELWNLPFTAPSLKYPIRFPILKNPNSKPGPSTHDINVNREEPESESKQPSGPRVPKIRPSSKTVPSYLESLPDNHSENENREEDHDNTLLFYNQLKNGGKSLSVPTISKQSNNLPENTKSPKGSWNWPYTASSLTSPIRFPKLRNPKSKPSPSTQDINNNREEPESESNQLSEPWSPKIRPSNKFVLSYPKSVPDNHSEDENNPEDHDAIVPIYNELKNGGISPSVLMVSKPSKNVSGKTKSPNGSWNWPFTAPSLKSPIRFPKLRNPKSKSIVLSYDITNNSEEHELESHSFDLNDETETLYNQAQSDKTPGVPKLPAKQGSIHWSTVNELSEHSVPKFSLSSKFVPSYLENLPENHSEDENRPEVHDTAVPIYNQPKNVGKSLSVPKVSKAGNNLPSQTKSPMSFWNRPLSSPFQAVKIAPSRLISPVTQGKPQFTSSQLSMTSMSKHRILEHEDLSSFPIVLNGDLSGDRHNSELGDDAEKSILMVPKLVENLPLVSMIPKVAGNIPHISRKPTSLKHWSEASVAVLPKFRRQKIMTVTPSTGYYYANTPLYIPHTFNIPMVVRNFIPPSRVSWIEESHQNVPIIMKNHPNLMVSSPAYGKMKFPTVKKSNWAVPSIPKISYESDLINSDQNKKSLKNISPVGKTSVVRKPHVLPIPSTPIKNLSKARRGLSKKNVFSSSKKKARFLDMEIFNAALTDTVQLQIDEHEALHMVALKKKAGRIIWGIPISTAAGKTEYLTVGNQEGDINFITSMDRTGRVEYLYPIKDDTGRSHNLHLKTTGGHLSLVQSDYHGGQHSTGFIGYDVTGEYIIPIHFEENHRLVIDPYAHSLRYAIDIHPVSEIVSEVYYYKI